MTRSRQRLMVILVLASGLWLLGVGASLAGVPRVAAAGPSAQALMAKYQCLSCHTLHGTGQSAAPVLDMVGNRRSREWIRKWLANPPATKPGTLMPRFPLSPSDLDTLAAYLASLRQPVNGPQIVARYGASAQGGRALFEAYQCLACHRIGRTGRFVGPDLEHLASRKTVTGTPWSAGWEERWLADPQAVKPGTFMPTFGLTPIEVRALTAYLATLK